MGHPTFVVRGHVGQLGFVVSHPFDKKRREDGAREIWGQRRWEGPGLAAFFAAGHDGGVEAVAEAGGEIVNLMGAVNLDGLAGGIEDDLAVAAFAEVGLQLGADLGGYRVVDQVVEQGEELFAGHFSVLDFPGLVSMGLFLRWK